MNNTNNHPKRPIRNIAWHALPRPTQCEHRYEVLAHEVGGALLRCVHCGGPEDR